MVRHLIKLIAILSGWIVYFFSISQYDLERKQPAFNRAIERDQVQSVPPPEDTKYILYWTTLFGKPELFTKTGKDLFAECEYNNCFATHNKSLLPSVDRYHAIIFNGPSAAKTEEEPVPARRSPLQRYVFMATETPVRCAPGNSTRNKHHCVARYLRDDFYNWTMTYRLDSDILRRSGYFERRKTNYILPTGEYVKNKTKMVAWFVSNCNSSNRREDLVEKLQKYIPVDVYGNCGNLDCPRGAQECFDMVERDYKFYLSFENSHCRDYVTEKLYNVLKRNTIPVVYGGADYSTLAPPYSVINVEDFKTVEQLANYLKAVAKDDESYLKYFEWKKHYVIKTASKDAACQLCAMLNEDTLPIKAYRNISDWWYNKRNSRCRADDDPPTISSSLG